MVSDVAVALGQTAPKVGHVATKPKTTHQRIGPWKLDIVRDPFTGDVSCRLRGRHMIYARSAMTFQFSPNTDTFDAMYRVDQGQAVSWRVNAMSLASRGISLQNESLSNSSAGRVVVPLSVIVAATTIAIRPSVKASARVFALKDLPLAFQAASKAGCGPSFEGDPE